VIQEDFLPSLLLVGIEIPNLAAGISEGLRDSFPVSAWARYRSGDPSLEGWLIDHSTAFRAYLVYRDWTQAAFSADRVRALDAEITSGSLPSGYGPDPRSSQFITQAPAQDDPQAQMFELLDGFTVDPIQLRAVEELVLLGGSVPLVLFEPPVHDTFLAFYGAGTSDYLKGLSAVQATAADGGAFLLDTTRLDLIPDEGWMNRNHLNMQGAEQFSRWLGAQVGQAVLEGALPDPFGGESPPGGAS
jgi:hypothetical protein